MVICNCCSIPNKKYIKNTGEIDGIEYMSSIRKLLNYNSTEDVKLATLNSIVYDGCNCKCHKEN